MNTAAHLDDTRHDPRALRHARRLSDPSALVHALGLGKGAQRQAGGWIVRCPVHEDRTPSCSVRVGRDGTIACRCHGCEWTGDALALVAAVHRLDPRRDFARVLDLAAELAGPGAVAAPAPRPSPMPERDYPAPSSVASLWSACVPVTDDDQAAEMLRDRAIDPEAVELHDLARVIPRGAASPSWASYRGSSWVETGHRLIVRAYDATGAARSVRAWRVVDADSPKRLPPAGHRAAGLVLADSLGALVLAGRNPENWPSPMRVLVVEGEPDFLTWASRASDADEDAPATFGVVSGAWTDAHAARVPAGARVILRGHGDASGAGYMDAIARSLAPRCDVRGLE